MTRGEVDTRPHSAVLRAMEYDAAMGRPPHAGRWSRRVARASLCLLVALIVVFVHRDVGALTAPLPGAVAFPSNVVLELPFPAGSEVYVLSGYSRSGGSSLHADTNATGKANDYYALDLTYASEPNSGKGLPITASLAGTVVKAGWATSGWANYGQRVILSHDLGDGHVYHTLYAHLDSIAVAEGQVLAQGATLGTLGQSCQGALSCGSFSTPHLHWALHRDSTIGGSGTGGSYGGNAVVPEPISGHEDLDQGQTLTSSNTGTPVCGDGFCSGGETGASCPTDCCGPVPPAGRIIDDEDPCFDTGGNPQYLYSTDEGYEGGAVWTNATDADAVDNSGTWSLTFAEAGDYVVRAYVEPSFAGTTSANYVVSHAGATDEVVIDQTASTGWIPLGTFTFDAGGGQSVFLGDATGEPLSEMRPIVFDAIELERVGASAGAGGGGAGGSGGDATQSAGGGIDGPSGTGGSGGGGAGLDATDGCSCSAPRSSSTERSLTCAVAAFLLLARRRRRACARRHTQPVGSSTTGSI